MSTWLFTGQGSCHHPTVPDDPDFPLDRLPEGTGIVLADAHGAEVARAAPRHPLAGARRKAVTLLFVHSAATSLHLLADPMHLGGR